MKSPLLHFLVIGFLLFVGTRLFASDEVGTGGPIVIDETQVTEIATGWAQRMGRMPSDREIAALVRQEVDDEILFREAVAAGLDRADSVVQRRLLMNAQFLGMEDASDEELLAQAYALDMHLTDPVVRRRLVQLMRSAVFAGARAEQVPSEEAELRARYEAEKDEFVVAPRVRIAHVYLGRDREGGEAQRARAALERIRTEQLSVDEAIRLGDPFLRGHELSLLSQRELEGYFGPSFAAEAIRVEPNGWSEPIESAYGLHLVKALEATPARQQPFEEVRERVRDEWMREREQARLRRVLDDLRGDYEVQVALPGQEPAAG